MPARRGGHVRLPVVPAGSAAIRDLHRTTFCILTRGALADMKDSALGACAHMMGTRNHVGCGSGLGLLLGLLLALRIRPRA